MVTRISFVMPAYEAADTIARTLRSIHEPLTGAPDLHAEVVIVDDGNPHSESIERAVAGFRDRLPVRCVRHNENRGVCAGRNTGVALTSGDYVVFLDADDSLDPSWPETFRKLIAEWPADVNVCFSACRNTDGHPTVSDPTFSGLLTFEDQLAERHPGEYLPMVRGAYAREHAFVDLGLRRVCGIVSYLTFAKDGPFWVSGHVLRIYDDARHGSVTHDASHPRRLREMATCYGALLERFGDDYRRVAPNVYRSKLLRLALYRRMAGVDKGWGLWRQAAHWTHPMESAGSLLMLALGSHFSKWAIRGAKRAGLIRKYG